MSVDLIRYCGVRSRLGSQLSKVGRVRKREAGVKATIKCAKAKALKSFLRITPTKSESDTIFEVEDYELKCSKKRESHF